MISPSFPLLLVVGARAFVFRIGVWWQSWIVLTEAGAIEVEEILRGKTRLGFGPFFEEAKFILKPSRAFESPEFPFVLFVSDHS